MSQLFGSIEGGGTKFVCCVAGGPDDIRGELRFPTTTPDETIGRAIDFFDNQERKYGMLAALGIGSFGPIDLEPGSLSYGYVTSTPKPGWKNTDFVGRIRERFDVPIGWDTDVNAAALGEHVWGAAKDLDTFIYLTVGTGVGGGTLLGLSRLLLHTVDPHEIDVLAQRGDPNGADLSLGDVIGVPLGRLPPDATAVNFGRLARQDLTVSREDLAAALITLVGQVIAITAINAAHAQQIECIVVTGHLTDMPSVRGVLGQVGEYYGVHIALPPDAGYATALGALLQVQQDR